MAFELIKGGAFIGVEPQSSTPSIGSFTASTTAATFVAQMVRMPKDGDLHSFELFMNAAAQVPTNGLRFSFQSPTSAGNPDNTDDQFRVVAAGSLGATTWVVPPGPITDDGTDGGVKRTVTAGELVACVIKFESFVAGDSVAFGTLANVNQASNDLVRRSTNSGGSWARTAPPFCLVIRYTDGYEWIHPFVWPVTAVTQINYNNGSTPDERGLNFTLPFDFEFGGFELSCLCASSTQSLVARLYSSTDSVLSSLTFTIGDFASASSLTRIFIPMTRFSPCSANTVHRLTVTPGGASNFSYHEATVASQDRLNAFGGGSTHFLTHRTDAGVWTDDATKRPLWRIQVTRLDAVVGGGRQGAYGFLG